MRSSTFRSTARCARTATAARLPSRRPNFSSAKKHLPSVEVTSIGYRADTSCADTCHSPPVKREAGVDWVRRMSDLAWVAEVAALLMPPDLPATTRLSAGYRRAREALLERLHHDHSASNPRMTGNDQD